MSFHFLEWFRSMDHTAGKQVLVEKERDAGSETESNMFRSIDALTREIPSLTWISGSGVGREDEVRWKCYKWRFETIPTAVSFSCVLSLICAAGSISRIYGIAEDGFSLSPSNPGRSVAVFFLLPLELCMNKTNWNHIWRRRTGVTPSFMHWWW